MPGTSSPAYVVVYAEIGTALEGDMPAFAALQGKLADAATYYAADTVAAGRSGAGGGWVGPGPRVTRANVLLEAFSYLTRVAWVWAWTDGAAYAADAASLRAVLADEVNVQLRRLLPDAASVAAWRGVQLLPYDPAVNGALAWWQSGDAARTATQNDPPEGLAHLGATENPVGPDNPNAVAPGRLPPGVAGDLGTVADKLTEVLEGAAVLAAVGVGAVALYKGAEYFGHPRAQSSSYG